MKRFFLGLDLGQVHDPSAVAILEADRTLCIRHLERMPLGLPYADVVKRVRSMTRSRELKGKCTVIADATGVGRPVIELLRSARLEAPVLPVLATAGDGESLDGGYFRVPKRDLIMGLQGRLALGELQIAGKLIERQTLQREMLQMRMRMGAARRERFAAWSSNQHDDLVFAVALACWGAAQPRD